MSSFLGLAYANPISIETESAEYVSRTRDNSLVGTIEGYPRWRVDITLEPRQFRNHQPLVLAHRARQGVLVPFTITMPQTVSGDFSSSQYDVRNAVIRGDNRALLRENSPSQLEVGRFFTFSNHSKVYVITGVGYSGSDATVTFYPNAVVSVPNTATWSPNAILTCTYSESSNGFFEVNRDSVVHNSISVIET